MALATDPAAVRIIDLAGYTGDAWADDATLAVPAATVQLFVATGGPIRLAVYAVATALPGAAQVNGTTCTLSVCVIKFASTGGTSRIRACAVASGSILAHDLSETDISQGEVFAIGIPAISVGDATFLSVEVYSGVARVLAASERP
jgi:hypothetical protein